MPVAYGHTLELGDHKVNVGAALKLLYGRAYDASVSVASVDMDLVLDQLTEAESGMSVGVDLGAQYLAMDDALAFGVVLRNINSPSFDTPLNQSIKEELQARAGVSYAFSERIYASLDVDITENKTLVADYKSRDIGGGVCLEVTEGISLRCGAKKNLAASDGPTILTAGWSLGGKGFHLDTAFTFALETFSFDSLTLPIGAGGLVSLQGVW